MPIRNAHVVLFLVLLIISVTISPSTASAQVDGYDSEAFEFYIDDSASTPLGYQLEYSGALNNGKPVTTDEWRLFVTDYDALSLLLRSPILRIMQTVNDAFTAYKKALTTSHVNIAELGLDDPTDTLVLRVDVVPGADSVGTIPPFIHVIKNASSNGRIDEVVTQLRLRLQNLDIATMGPQIKLTFTANYQQLSLQANRQRSNVLPQNALYVDFAMPGDLQIIADGLNLRQAFEAVSENGSLAVQYCGADGDRLNKKKLFMPTTRTFTDLRAQTFSNVARLFNNIVIPNPEIKEAYYLVLENRYGSVEFQLSSTDCHSLFAEAHERIDDLHQYWTSEFSKVSELPDDNSTEDMQRLRADPSEYAWDAGKYTFRFGRLYQVHQIFEKAALDTKK